MNVDDPMSKIIRRRKSTPASLRKRSPSRISTPVVADGPGGAGSRPASAKKDTREFVFNRRTVYEGLCVECNHLHEAGVLCGKVADLNTLDKCRCTRGRKLKTKFVSGADKRKNRMAALRAASASNAGWVCTVDDRCGASFPTDLEFYEHMNEECPYRKVPCIHAGRGCKIESMHRDKHFHEKYCAFREAEEDEVDPSTVTRVMKDPQTNEKIVVKEARATSQQVSPSIPATELTTERQRGLLQLFQMLDTDHNGCVLCCAINWCPSPTDPLFTATALNPQLARM